MRRTPRNVPTQRLLPVMAAQGDHLVLADGSLRAVLECPTLAFGLKGEAERRAVTAGWAALLNSLTHPIHVVISTRSADMPSATAAGESTDVRTRLLKSQGELLAGLSSEKALIDRHIFMVVPSDGRPPRAVALGLIGGRQADAGDAAGQLDQRVRWICDALRRIDLNPTALGADKLKNLFYGLMGGTTARVQPLTASAAAAWSDMVAPAAFAEGPAQVRLGERLARTLAVTTYPQLLRPSWLDVLLGFSGDLDISLHIAPAATQQVMSFLERRIAQLSSTIRIAQDSGRHPDAYRRAALEDAADLQERIARGDERLFDMGLYLTVWADDAPTLESSTRRLEALLGSVLVNSRWLLFRMEPGLISSLPLGLDRVGLRRCLPTSVLAATFPFSGNDLAASSGVLYGVNPQARSPVVLDRFRLPNHNEVVFGTSGGGKSHLVKRELIQSMLADVRVLAIDGENEYGRVVAALGGVVVSVRPGAPMGFDPFAITNQEPGALTKRVDSLLTLIELLAGGLSANQRAAAEEALSFAYAVKGFSDDEPDHGDQPPDLRSVQQALTRRLDRWQGVMGSEVQELSQRLERYVSGAGSWLFRTAAASESGDHSSVVYDVAGLPEEDRAAAMFLVLDRIWSSLGGNQHPTLVVVDEAWWLMQHPDTARFLQRLAKTARKRRAGLTLITQDVGDVLNSPLGEAIVSNAAVQILMRQAPQVMPQIANLFQLTEAEQTWLLSAQQGEGLLLAMGKRVPFLATATNEERRIIEEAA